MHIKIENDQNETEAVLCIERGMMARVLLYKSEHLRTLINIAQSLGAQQVLISTIDPEIKQVLEGMGFVESLNTHYQKVINGPKSKRG